MLDIFAGSLMSTPVESVTPDASLQAVAQRMIEADIGSVVVVDDTGNLEGILTGTDFVELAADGVSPAETTVSDAMTTDVVTASATDSIEDVAATITSHGFRHLPIVDGRAVVGIITTADLADYLSKLEPSVR